MDAAQNLRRALRIDSPMFPILHVVENLLPQEIEDFSFEVKEADEMGDNHGLTHPELKEIWIRADVYEGAYRGLGRDRFTIAHELGHFLLHGEQGLARRRAPAKTLKPYLDSEWQANSFAGALLIPVEAALATPNALDLAVLCGVSVDAAAVQLKVLNQQGMLK